MKSPSRKWSFRFFHEIFLLQLSLFVLVLGFEHVFSITSMAAMEHYNSDIVLGSGFSNYLVRKANKFCPQAKQECPRLIRSHRARIAKEKELKAVAASTAIRKDLLANDNWKVACENSACLRTRKLVEGNSSNAAALLSIRSSLQDPGNLLFSWNLSTNPHVCLGWYGVSCSISGDITALDLAAVNTSQTLSGSLPSSIGQLASLQLLSIVNHDLSGPLPKELGLLPSLQILNLSSNAIAAPFPVFQNPSSLVTLDLSKNMFSDSFSDILGRLAAVNQSLQHLDLSENFIWGELTAELLAFSSLSYLDVLQNNLTGTIPVNIGTLKSLKILDLSVNDFTGEIPSSLGLLSNLSTLVLDHNNFTGSIPVALKNCSSLSIVSLNNNELTGTIADEILEARSQTLTYFSAEANFLEGQIPSSFKNCSLLETLDLSVNNFTGSIPIDLCSSNQSQLSFLVLDVNALSGQLPLHLATCPNLQHLGLSFNNFTGSIPERYASDLQLVEFSAANNRLNGSLPRNLTSWIRGGLKTLFLDNNNITGNLPEAIGRIATLEQLLINSNFLSGSIPSSILNCSNLQILSLSENSLTGNIPSGFRSLQNLNLIFLQRNRLQGELPAELGELPNLSRMNFSYNALSGAIPDSFGNLGSLNYLALSSNNFSGLIPASLGKLGLLVSLRLNNNCLSGNVPLEISNLTALGTLLLHNNNLTGEFPWEVLRASAKFERLDLANNSFVGRLPSDTWEKHATSLFRVRLQGNSFSGSIPEELSSLVGLQCLELHSNQFSGHIPSGFSNLSMLSIFNVSNNRLSGEIPGGALLNFNASSFQGNLGLCGAQLMTNCREKVKALSDPKLLSAIIISCLLLVVLLVTGTVYIIFFKVKKERETVYSFKDVGVKLSLKVIRDATQNFDKTFIIGEGGQGTVFRATLENGQDLAVKRCINIPLVQKLISSEVQTLGQVRHRNLATLVACIVAEEELLILYEFVAGGDLYDTFISEKGKRKKRFLPSWKESFELILGSAQGLEYLHHGCPISIIHRDIKPANILLGEDNTPKIGDFGLSRFMNDSKPHVSTTAAGTVGYLAPECSETGKVTTASDVFSFGVVMLGIVTGMSPNSYVAQEMEFSAWVEECGFAMAKDSRVEKLGKEEEEQMEKVIALGLLCCSDNSNLRPTMQVVVKELRGLELQDPCDGVRLEVDRISNLEGWGGR